jgi:hypothetical protein
MKNPDQAVHACCEDASWSLAFDANGWYLDEDYRRGANIKFCPFCGEKLPDPPK